VLATDDLQRKAEEFRKQEQDYQERVRQALAYYYDNRVDYGVSVQKAAKKFGVKYAAVRDLKNKTEGR
jgi:transposase